MNIFSVSSISEATAVPADDIEGVRYFAQLTESLPTLVRLGTGEILLQTDADNVSAAYKKFLSGGNTKKSLICLSSICHKVTPIPTDSNLLSQMVPTTQGCMIAQVFCQLWTNWNLRAR